MEWQAQKTGNQGHTRPVSIKSRTEPKVVTPPDTRAAFAVIQEEAAIYHRHAWRLLGLLCSIFVHQFEKLQIERALQGRPEELAAERCLFGYWRLNTLLRQEVESEPQTLLSVLPEGRAGGTKMQAPWISQCSNNAYCFRIELISA